MLRVGLVGCGFMGRMHSQVYRALPNATIAAVCDTSPDVAAKFATEFGASVRAKLEELVQDPSIDAVDICLPTHLHRAATELAAKAGKHVICEKPMALSLADADAMSDACRAAGVRFMVAHCIRFWPEYAMLKRLTDSGELGRLLSVNLTRYGQFPSWSSQNWLADEALSGGGALDMHIHDTDFALYLLGAPKAVHSYGTVDARGVSQIFTTLEYDGAVAHLEGGWNLPPGTPFKMAFRAIFERGAAIMDGGPMTIYREGGEPETPTFERMSAEGGGNISDLGGYYFTVKEFVDRVTDGRPFTVSTPETSRAALALALEEIAQVKAKQGNFPT